MLNPVGPLPASVYWRRRAVAVAVLGLAVVLLLTLLPGGGDDGRRRAAGHAGSASPSAGGPTPDPESATLTATPPPADSGRQAAGGRDAARSDDGAGSGSGSGGQPGAEPVTRSSAPPPPLPQPCTDRALRLTVRAEEPAYTVGTLPVLLLTVRNVSRVTCLRDLGAAHQEVLLYQGRTRLWSSNDCYPEGSKDVQALAPGEDVTFSVTWSGKSSRPRCAGVRTRVGPGRYELLGRISTLRSDRAPLVLR